MPNDPSQAVSYATIVGVVSAVAAIISAFLSFISYRKSSVQFEKDRSGNFINKSKEKLDKAYIDLSEFIQEFTGSRETKAKRIVRDRILFSLEAMRVDFLSCKFTSEQIDNHFGSISLKISDITYEKNFEKNMHDLSIVKADISVLKRDLIALGGF